MNNFFSEKQQKPQQVLKPLVYDRQTSAKQENFTDDFFPLTDFWIIPPLGGLQRLRDVRKQVFKMLQEIPVKQNKVKTTGKPEENIHEDLLNEFLEEKIERF